MIAMKSPIDIGGSKQKALDKHAFASLMSKSDGKKPMESSLGKRHILSPTP